MRFLARRFQPPGSSRQSEMAAAALTRYRIDPDPAAMMLYHFFCYGEADPRSRVFAALV